MIFKSPVERGGPQRGKFEDLAEKASNMTSSPLFFLICLAFVGFFVASHAAGLSVEWLLLAGESMSAVTLLLLALLKNSEMRAEHAIQRKLDAIAGALLDMNKGKDSRALRELRDSIRMEEET
ncbi:low affinity iron permease family protein [Streptomyces sp. TP-A0356]|uniref:low affinity iron permease family protein n=1 Tax=Streptomyces sp. TP-A0356 TaxID=1359208 RepID=UPI0006E27026|nr:low affinity iron permease family protein [Streptomyces sp. TP-A0356]